MTKPTSLREAVPNVIRAGDCIYAAGMTHLIPFAARHAMTTNGLALMGGGPAVEGRTAAGEAQAPPSLGGPPTVKPRQIVDSPVGDTQNDPLTPRSVAVATALFAAMVLGNRLHAFLCGSIIETSCVPFWPVSVFMLRSPPNLNYPNPAHLAVAMTSIVLLVAALRLLHRRRYPIWMVAGFGLALILATTLTHGIQMGLQRPIAGMGVTEAEYFNDSEAIEDPWEFIRGFEILQPSLYGHSATHPPGAVLLFYALRVLLANPGVIALAVATIATGLTALTFAAAAASHVEPAVAGQTLFLLLLVPAIHVYYAASLDAVIAPLMLGSVLWVTSGTRGRLLVSTACLILVSMLTFNFLFALPIMAVMAWNKRGGMWRLAVQLGALGLFWALVYALVGYNYVHSFAIASVLENPAGFRLLSTPGDYLMTRIEDVAEIVLFLGPIPILLVARAIRNAGWKNDLVRLSGAAIGSLLLVFLTGAYRTGETARAAVFIYPFLMLPVTTELARPPVARRFSLLAGVTFAQTLLMQLVGNYFW